MPTVSQLADLSSSPRLLKYDAGTSFSNSVSATSVLSAGAITGGFPAGYMAGDTLHIVATGYFLTTGANMTWAWTVKFGSTALATGTSASIALHATNKHRWVIDLWCIYLAIGSSSSVAVTGYVAIGTGTTANFDNLQASASSYWNGGTTVSSLNTTTGGTLDIQATHGANTATSTSACEGMSVLYFPNNS